PAAAFARPASRSLSTTAAPASAMRRAIPRPMPEPAPVTTATLSARSKSWTMDFSDTGGRVYGERRAHAFARYGRRARHPVWHRGHRRDDRVLHVRPRAGRDR